jgi:excisionase family DNA binding protein
LVYNSRPGATPIDELLLNAIRKVVREELRANGHHLKNAKYVGVKEVAALLGVHQSTIPRWCKKGRLPKPFRKPWGQPHWRLDEVLKCIERD